MRGLIKKYKLSLTLFLISAAVHAAGLFIAQNTEADATSRVLLAEELGDNFRVIYSGHWPSLQYYFLSLFIWLFNDRVWGPLILCAVLGSIAVLPFYGFCANLFTKKGAFFSSVIFIFCPVILRNSFIPLSEIFYLCFVCFALYPLSYAWKNDTKKYRNAIKAGLFMTLAAGMRIEAWMLIPMLCIPFLFHRDFKSAFYFCLAASVFPAFWMAGNYIDYGDLLYSIHSVENWNFNVEGHNEGIDKTEVIRRFIFFPFSLSIMLTPLGIAILLYYAVKKIRHKKITKAQLGLLLIFILLFVVYIFQCIDGRLFMQHRFTITLVLFSIPFFAWIYESEKLLKIKYSFSFLLVLIIIPYSYYWHIVPFSKLFFFNERLKNTMNLVVADSYHQTGAIPLLENKKMDEIVKSANESLQKNDGVVVDFDSWENTYYFAQSVDAGYHKIFICAGGKNAVNDPDKFHAFLQKNPGGILLLKDFSDFESRFPLYGNCLQAGEQFGLELIKTGYFDHLRLFRYRYLEGNNFLLCKEKNAGLPGLYSKTRDVEFFKEKIIRDKPWLASVIQKAIENKISIDEMIERDAIYVYRLENQ